MAITVSKARRAHKCRGSYRNLDLHSLRSLRTLSKPARGSKWHDACYRGDRTCDKRRRSIYSASGSKESLNMKGAYFEVLSDMLTSVGVIIAGVIMLTTGWYYADPLISAGIGLFIFPRTCASLKMRSQSCSKALHSVNIAVFAIACQDQGSLRFSITRFSLLWSKRIESSCRSRR